MQGMLKRIFIISLFLLFITLWGYYERQDMWEDLNSADFLTTNQDSNIEGLQIRLGTLVVSGSTTK